MQSLPSLFILLCLLLAALLPAAAGYSAYDRSTVDEPENLMRILQRVMRRRAIPESYEQFNEFSAPAKRHARIGGTIVMGRR
ncbi:hypothetical protein PRIPAC_74907 [Pristionchus pacificus]|uniref:Uncharacterized protein n=1 Tax=Pristionchus pacificus TaxID=54126 RepID=A0A2A6BZV4_PRIPA|nr:hypothetical protein PRIPAC_74907 [Pristionchus pacificus]|eukprot:PDM71455.1 hypothetical protein PRIPAC_37862 [Pristionchus pacificus]